MTRREVSRWRYISGSIWELWIYSEQRQSEIFHTNHEGGASMLYQTIVASRSGVRMETVQKIVNVSPPHAGRSQRRAPLSLGDDFAAQDGALNVDGRFVAAGEHQAKGCLGGRHTVGALRSSRWISAPLFPAPDHARGTAAPRTPRRSNEALAESGSSSHRGESRSIESAWSVSSAAVPRVMTRIVLGHPVVAVYRAYHEIAGGHLRPRGQFSALPAEADAHASTLPGGEAQQ